jgi:bacterioferritin-associated ferredoxin
MYVCVCNALNDRTIAAKADGARTVAEVFRRCESRPQCGKCIPDIARVIEDCRSAAQPLALAAE